MLSFGEALLLPYESSSIGDFLDCEYRLSLGDALDLVVLPNILSSSL